MNEARPPRPNRRCAWRIGLTIANVNYGTADRAPHTRHAEYAVAFTDGGTPRIDRRSNADHLPTDRPAIS